MKKNVKLVFLILQICVSIILFTRTVTCQPWDGDSIQLKPYKVLLVSGIQIRDDYVIHQAYDTSDIAALLKIWGIPFDVLRLDTTWMTINHFLNSSGEAEYGTIIWTARQNQYPWQSQDYKVLKQAVEDYNISLIAVGNRIQEPLIQELLGIQFQNWGAISNPVIITASLHFISRNISNTSIPAGEAFAGGNGPRITVSASDTEVLAVSGTWPQLTTRVSNPATRTSSTWIGGNMDSIFCNSPVFIELFKRSLIWAVGYGIYK